MEKRAWSFQLSVMVNKDGKTYKLKCANPALCKITYNQGSTPLLRYIQPNVVYKGMKVRVFFHPRGA
jgi:formaldehyde-activating enzyme involved in methanogenesis